MDETSLASTAQMHDLLRIATTLRVLRVVLVGDEKQLDGVEAGKPFAQLKQARMLTVAMDEIVRHRDAELKAAVQSTLEGEVKAAFRKLGGRVSEVPKDNLPLEVAVCWLEGLPQERERTGVIAPTRALRDAINEHIRGYLVWDGPVDGPERKGEKLVSLGWTDVEKGFHGNYTPGDIVTFNRPYKTLGVGKGDERTVAGIDHDIRTVQLSDDRGRTVAWELKKLAGDKGGVEVYRCEGMELCAGTASDGSATTGHPVSSTGRWPKSKPSRTTAFVSAWKTERCSSSPKAIPNSASRSTTGPRPCMRSGAGP